MQMQQSLIVSLILPSAAASVGNRLENRSGIGGIQHAPERRIDQRRGPLAPALFVQRGSLVNRLSLPGDKLGQQKELAQAILWNPSFAVRTTLFTGSGWTRAFGQSDGSHFLPPHSGKIRLPTLP